MEARILLYESRAGSGSLAPVLEGLGAKVSVCRDRMCLLEQLMSFRPRVVVYAVGTPSPADQSMLEMLRRLAPGIPLAVVVPEHARALAPLALELRPLWWGTAAETCRLLDALRGALRLPAVSGPFPAAP